MIIIIIISIVVPLFLFYRFVIFLSAFFCFSVRFFYILFIVVLFRFLSHRLFFRLWHTR